MPHCLRTNHDMRIDIEGTIFLYIIYYLLPLMDVMLTKLGRRDQGLWAPHAATCHCLLFSAVLVHPARNFQAICYHSEDT